MYVNLVNWFMISHLIIPSHPLHPFPESTWSWSMFYDLSSDYLFPSSISIFSPYVNLANCFKISHLISHTILFIRLQIVRNLVNCFRISHLIIPYLPFHLSPGCTWTGSIDLRSLIWSSHHTLFIPLQYASELGVFKISIWSSHPILFIRFSWYVNPSI